MAGLHRRRLIRGALAGGGACALTGLGNGSLLGAPRTRAPRASPGAGGDYAAEVDAGLEHVRRRAGEHTARTERLLAAIAGGDLAAARAAYVAARPLYEEIEVLAASFPETDEAIDARPYALSGGETDPAFVSIHRIEAFLYRDENLEAAHPFARGLVDSARRLEADLQWRDAFAAPLSFERMIALANEIASKKVSSEEETWSDQSLLIFRHNRLGIRGQYEPFAAATAADPVAAAAVDHAHAAALAAIADYPPAPGGAFPPYGAVPPGERGGIVRASYAYRDALARARDVLGLA